MSSAIFHDVESVRRAMRDGSKRYERHLERGLVAIESSQIKSSGPGRGRKRLFSTWAVMQGAIALPLIDCGVDARTAYMIGARFVYSGGFEGPLLTDSTAKLDPSRDRAAGRLFGAGDTWLVVGPVSASGERDFTFVSDADPTFSPPRGASQLGMIAEAVCDGEPGPRIFMNISALCAFVADALDIDGDAEFGGVA